MGNSCSGRRRTDHTHNSPVELQQDTTTSTPLPESSKTARERSMREVAMR